MRCIADVLQRSNFYFSSSREWYWYAHRSEMNKNARSHDIKFPVRVIRQRHIKHVQPWRLFPSLTKSICQRWIRNVYRRKLRQAALCTGIIFFPSACTGACTVKRPSLVAAFFVSYWPCDVWKPTGLLRWGMLDWARRERALGIGRPVRIFLSGRIRRILVSQLFTDNFTVNKESKVNSNDIVFVNSGVLFSKLFLDQIESLHSGRRNTQIVLQSQHPCVFRASEFDHQVNRRLGHIAIFLI